MTLQKQIISFKSGKSILVTTFFVILSLSALSASLTYKTVRITDSFRYTYPGEGNSFYIEDKSKTMTPDDFYREYLGNKGTLNFAKMPYFNKPQSAWWIGMQIRNESSKPRKLVLESDFVYMDELDFYLWEDGQLIKRIQNFSSNVGPLERDLPHRVFATDFEAHPGKTYLWALRMTKSEGHLPFPLKLYDYRVFEQQSKVIYTAHGISIGIMLLGIIVGLALFRLSRDRMYGYYVAYIFSVSGMAISEQGYLSQYFWRLYNVLPNKNTWMYFVAAGVFFHVSFSMLFLGIEKLPKTIWLNIGKALMAGSAAIFILAFIPGTAAHIYEAALLLGLLFSLLNIAFILVAFYHRHPVAIMYLVAVGPFTVTCIYIALSTLGILPESWLVFEIYKYGSTFEILVLSLVVCFIYQRTLRLKSLAELELSRERERVLTAINEAQESERSRIAKELHDSVGSMLGAIRLRMSATQKQQAEEGKKLKEMSWLLEKAAEEVRRVSHDLMPASLLRHGLVAALNEIYGGLSRPYVRIIADLFRDGHLDQGTELLLLRIIQELVNNSLKHADADEISIQLISDPELITLIYEDDGKGFDPDLPGRQSGMGFQNIRFRTEYLKGTLLIESAPDRGFICTVTFRPFTISPTDI